MAKTKLLKFKQDFCTPCAIAEGFMKDDLKVEADETLNLSTGDPYVMDMVEKYEVMQTPTLVLVDENGDKIRSVTGVGASKIKGIFAERGLI